MAQRAAEAQAEADALLAQANSGEDIAGQVEQQQAEVETVEPERKRGIGRRR
jgi:hypothetical protein